MGYKWAALPVLGVLCHPEKGVFSLVKYHGDVLGNVAVR